MNATTPTSHDGGDYPCCSIREQNRLSRYGRVAGLPLSARHGNSEQCLSGTGQEYANMFNSTKPRRKPVYVLLPLLLAALAATGLGTASAHDIPGVQHPTQFTDVHPHSFYATAVDWMVQNGITTGTSDTTFHPDRNVPRGEAAAFLWRMSCRPQPAGPHSFSDVHAVWQQQPVSWLQQYGAAPVPGTDTEPDDVFNPATLLTRAQVAALLYQLFGDDVIQETVSPFADVTEPWQTAPVLWLLATGVSTGTSATTFDPDRSVTRGEFATFLWRLSYQPGPAQRICQPPPVVEPEPSEGYLLPERIVDFSGCGSSFVSPGEQFRLIAEGFAADTAVSFNAKAVSPDGTVITAPTLDASTANAHGAIDVLWTIPAATGSVPRVYAVDATGLNTSGGTHTVYMITALVAYPSTPLCATDDTAATIRGQAVDITVLDNDTAPTDGSLDVMSMRILGTSDEGFVVDQTTGVVTYTPPPGFYGTAVGGYVVSDIWEIGLQAEITVTVASDCTVTGTAYVTEIVGTESDDVICVSDAEVYREFHVIYGLGGNDVIIGGEGTDWIYGDDGADTIFGGGGEDRIVGGVGVDTIYGGPGVDTVYSLDLDDIIIDDDYVLVLTPKGVVGSSTPPATSDDWAWVAVSGVVDIYVLGNDHYTDQSSLTITRQPTAGAATVVAADYGRYVVKYTAAATGGTATFSYQVCGPFSFGECADAEVTVLVGSAGCTIVGTDAGETLNGTSGDDVICARGGDDVVYGLGGDDIILGGSGDDTLHGGDGKDILFGEDGNDTLAGNRHEDLLYGGDGDDTIDGGTGDDVIYGGNFGHNTLDGGTGDDTIIGANGYDTLRGGDGDDVLWGYYGNDIMHGNAGADILYGGGDDDSLDGGTGDDLLWGNQGDDVLYGRDHDDQLAGGYGSDILYGGAGDDWLFGGLGAGVLDIGAYGADTLDGGPGTDHLDGGPDIGTCLNGESTTYCIAEPPQ